MVILVMLLSFSVPYQRSQLGGVVRNEPPVILALTQEGAKSLPRVEQGPLPDDRGIRRGTRDSLGTDLTIQVLEVVLQELSPFWGGLESGGSEGR